LYTSMSLCCLWFPVSTYSLLVFLSCLLFPFLFTFQYFSVFMGLCLTFQYFSVFLSLCLTFVYFGVFVSLCLSLSLFLSLLWFHVILTWIFICVSVCGCVCVSVCDKGVS
jgi:hypothetical protein